MPLKAIQQYRVKRCGGGDEGIRTLETATNRLFP